MVKEYICRQDIEKFIEDGLNNPNKLEAFGYDAVEILSEIHYMPCVVEVNNSVGEWVSFWHFDRHLSSFAQIRLPFLQTQRPSVLPDWNRHV